MKPIAKETADLLAPGAIHVLEQAKLLGYLPPNEKIDFFVECDLVFCEVGSGEHSTILCWDGSSWNEVK